MPACGLAEGKKTAGGSSIPSFLALLAALAAAAAAELSSACGGDAAAASEHRTYAARLLDELRRGVAGSAAGGPALRLVPWALASFCEGLRKFQRSAQAGEGCRGCYKIPLLMRICRRFNC